MDFKCMSRVKLPTLIEKNKHTCHKNDSFQTAPSDVDLFALLLKPIDVLWSQVTKMAYDQL